MPEQLYSSYKSSDYVNIGKIISVSYFTIDKNVSIDSQTYDFWEFLYVDKGEVSIIRDGEQIKLKHGDVIFSQPGLSQTVCASRSISANLFILSFTSKSKSMNNFKNLHLRLPPYFQQFINNMYSESEKTFNIDACTPYKRQLKPLDKCVLGGTQMIKAYLQQFLIKLARKNINSDSFCTCEETYKPVVSETVKFLKNNVYGKINITELCSALGYGKTYVCSEFKKAMNMSIMQYFTSLKIREAKNLIRERNYNFMEISDILMFSDSHYFTNSFKKNTGMTPKQYLYSITKN